METINSINAYNPMGISNHKSENSLSNDAMPQLLLNIDDLKKLRESVIKCGKRNAVFTKWYKHHQQKNDPKNSEFTIGKEKYCLSGDLVSLKDQLRRDKGPSRSSRSQYEKAIEGIDLACRFTTIEKTLLELEQQSDILLMSLAPNMNIELARIQHAMRGNKYFEGWMYFNVPNGSQGPIQREMTPEFQFNGVKYSYTNITPKQISDLERLFLSRGIGKINSSPAIYADLLQAITGLNMALEYQRTSRRNLLSAINKASRDTVLEKSATTEKVYKRERGYLRQFVLDWVKSKKLREGASVPDHRIAEIIDALKEDGYPINENIRSSIRSTLSRIGYSKEK